MRLLRSLLVGPALAASVLWPPVAGAAICDADGADAADLAAAYAAIESSCPCGGSARADYVRCARQAVMSRIDAGSLSPECRGVAFRYPRRSRCGQQDAVVCCRIGRAGLERHRIVPSDRCVARPGGTACVSEHDSIVTGCDPNGCVPLAACGNGAVEPGEDCDPPDGVTCDFSCRAVVCEDATSSCGNGAVDAGEECEPPGTATCDAGCRSVDCGPAPAGESTLACLGAAAGVGAGSNGESVLVSWSTRFQQPGWDVLARRLDASGTPIDPAPTLLSANLQCEGSDSGPAVASDGTDYAVAWSTVGSLPAAPGFFIEAIYARGVAGGGGPTGGAVLLEENVPFGSCTSSIGGPVATAAGPGDRYTVLHRVVAGCTGTFLVENPEGTLVPLPAGAPLTDFALDPIGGPPRFFGGGAATVASLGADTLAAWPSTAVAGSIGVVAPVMRGGWIDATGATPPFIVGFARWASSPAAVAGDVSFLVPFAARVDDAATVATEIRGFRVTRAAGSLDPDLGSLLASSSTQITAGPAAAFDGGVWLVVWVEVSGGGHDLRAVAVRPDGTVVDAAPRLLAAGVANVRPAATSVGDGTVLVLFNRPAAGGAVAVNTIRVDGS
jgi:hypothetical protein